MAQKQPFQKAELRGEDADNSKEFLYQGQDVRQVNDKRWYLNKATLYSKLKSFTGLH